MPAAPDLALDVAHLVKSYDDRAVVDDLNLTAVRGKITAVLGPNGAGKTTTIECCEGLRTPDSGSITVLGLPPTDPRLRSRVGVMLQDSGLPTGARSLEVLRHVASMYDDARDIDDLVERLGLAAFARTTVRRLSGGQRQRLALATAVVGNPELVFLDEPSAGMDPQSRHAVWQLVRELRDEGVSFVLTTHLMDEAEALADDVVVVDHGQVIARGTVAELTSTRVVEHGSTTTLRWRTRAGLDLTQLTGRLPDQWTVSESAPGEYTALGLVTPTVLTQVVTWCGEQDALVTDLGVDRRTLEDAFLDLTGRTLR